MRHASAHHIVAGEFRRGQPNAAAAQYLLDDVAHRRRAGRWDETDNAELGIVHDGPPAYDRAPRQLMRHIGRMLDMRGMRRPAAGGEREEKPEPDEAAR